MAIWLRLNAAQLGRKPKNEKGEISKEFQAYRRMVSRFMGWSEGSNMWEQEYAKDALEWQSAESWIRPLVRSYWNNFRQHMNKNEAKKALSLLQPNGSQPRCSVFV